MGCERDRFLRGASGVSAVLNWPRLLSSSSWLLRALLRVTMPKVDATAFFTSLSNVSGLLLGSPPVLRSTLLRLPMIGGLWAAAERCLLG